MVWLHSITLPLYSPVLCIYALDIDPCFCSSGVLAQVDEEIAAQEQRMAIHMLQKELADIDTDVR